MLQTARTDKSLVMVHLTVEDRNRQSRRLGQTHNPRQPQIDPGVDAPAGRRRI
jgi:hypothetical protein